MSAPSAQSGSILETPAGLAPPPPDTAPLLFLVASLLSELQGPANILECTLLPPEDRYAIRLHAPRESSKAVLLPRRPLERALVDPAARARVRNLLGSAMEALRGRPTAKQPQLAPYFAALEVRSSPGPHCAYCEGPLLPEDPVIVRESSRWHLACPPAW
jgi:hypothetical protein